MAKEDIKNLTDISAVSDCYNFVADPEHYFDGTNIQGVFKVDSWRERVGLLCFVGQGVRDDQGAANVGCSVSLINLHYFCLTIPAK